MGEKVTRVLAFAQGLPRHPLRCDYRAAACEPGNGEAAMDEKRFDQVAHDELARLEQAFGTLGELEVDSTGDVLTVEFEDDSTFVINSHRAARQIWVSAEMSASHFNFDEQLARWFDTKSGEELWARLEGATSRKLGREVELRR
jgi:CyaY protein